MGAEKKDNVYRLDFKKRRRIGPGKAKPRLGKVPSRGRPVKRKRSNSLDPRDKPVQAMLIFGVIVFLVTVYLRFR